jgi:hypothetical protein
MAERYKKRGDRTNEGNGATPSKKRTATGSAVKHRSGAQGGAPAMPDETAFSAGCQGMNHKDRLVSH